MDNNEYLDFDGAVEFLKTTPSTLYKWLQAGKVPGHKLGRQWRFLREELELYVSGRGSKIQVQKDFINLCKILDERSNKKENAMEPNISKLAEKIIWDAFDHGSRLVHIYPARGKYEISYRTRQGLDQLSTIQEDFFTELDSALQAGSSAIGDEETRRMYLHRDSDDVLQVRYQKLETVTGSRVTLRMWQPEKDVLPLEKISGNKDVLNEYKSWLKQSHGFLLVTGAPGSGKTTTMYSLLNELQKQKRVVFTIEETVQLIIEGINQVELKGKNVHQFESVFDQVYSSDPDVIALGFSSYHGIEEKFFNAAYSAAAAGHLVVIQMNHSSCSEAVEFLKKYVRYPVDHLIAGVSCQKLVEQNGALKAHYDFYRPLNS
jgi:excisionase family DNA binding protein